MENKDNSSMSNEALAIHVDYLRNDVQKVLIGMSEMATKSDMEKIVARMDKFVTQDRFEALEKKVDSGTIGSSVTRAMLTIQRVAVTAAAVTALFGMIAAIVHFFDKI